MIEDASEFRFVADGSLFPNLPGRCHSRHGDTLTLDQIQEAITDPVPAGTGPRPAGPSTRWALAWAGSDPRKSVLNQLQQIHDIKNLFVVDGAGFTSTACQNPTPTIIALCVRSRDYLIGELKMGNV
jgi:GMC oxidoreductase